MAKDGGEHWAKMVRQNMKYPAWRALSVHAQALPLGLKLVWKGPRNRNDGLFRCRSGRPRGLSDAAPRQRIMRWWTFRRKAGLSSADRPFWASKARAREYELTELAMPPGNGNVSPVKGNPVPRNLFRNWQESNDLPVAEVRTNNPTGRNGIQNRINPRGIRNETRQAGRSPMAR